MNFLEEGGANPKGGDTNLLFCTNFPKSCMKMKMAKMLTLVPYGPLVAKLLHILVEEVPSFDLSGVQSKSVKK